MHRLSDEAIRVRRDPDQSDPLFYRQNWLIAGGLRLAERARRFQLFHSSPLNVRDDDVYIRTSRTNGPRGQPTASVNYPESL